MSLPFESEFNDPLLRDFDGRDSWSGSLEVVPDVHYIAPYSLKATRTSDVCGFARQTVFKNVTTNIIYVRLYTFFTTLPGVGPQVCRDPTAPTTGNNIYVAMIRNLASGNTIAAPFIRTDPSWGIPPDHETRWVVNYFNGAKTYFNTDVLVEILRWYCVEVMAKRSSQGANDGEVRLWVDEQLLLEQTGLNNYGAGPIDRILIGQGETTPFYEFPPEITTYFDTLKMDVTGPIGPVSTARHNLILESLPVNVESVLDGALIGPTPQTKEVAEGIHTPEIPYEA